MNAFQTLLAAFSEKTGLNIEPGVDGSVEIEADGVFVTVQNRENQGDIVMFALPLYDVAADSRSKLRRLLPSLVRAAPSARAPCRLGNATSSRVKKEIS